MSRALTLYGSAALEAAAERSTRVGNEEMPDRVRWIRSYVVSEADGGLGAVCVYEVSTPTPSVSTPAARGLRRTR